MRGDPLHGLGEVGEKPRAFSNPTRRPEGVLLRPRAEPKLKRSITTLRGSEGENKKGHKRKIKRRLVDSVLIAHDATAAGC